MLQSAAVSAPSLPDHDAFYNEMYEAPVKLSVHAKLRLFGLIIALVLGVNLVNHKTSVVTNVVMNATVLGAIQFYLFKEVCI